MMHDLTWYSGMQVTTMLRDFERAVEQGSVTAEQLEELRAAASQQGGRVAEAKAAAKAADASPDASRQVCLPSALAFCRLISQTATMALGSSASMSGRTQPMRPWKRSHDSTQ